MNAIFVVLTVTGCLVPLLISFGYGITKLLEKNCSKNDDCLISEICENYKCINLCSKLECGRNEGCFAYNHTVSCKCAPGFSINTNKNETCQKFHYGTSCGIDYTETFYDDMCDKVQCNENEICLNHITNNNHSCECKFGYIPNSEQKCVKKVSSGCSTDKHCHFSEICKNGACVSACSDLNCNKMNFYTLNACLAYDHDATCGCGDGLQEAC
ncbi:hypothetical protein PV328_001359 [Microctonus aethiopoides]|uniref:EGF-like domain-containing protein n=1 Tax=Microctonus aethiopoides TaxID=144406 RepID=A0AA39FX89_9HYME|nr:hypothetical protein PV328_001359 [Microctonus aethiopoides]